MEELPVDVSDLDPQTIRHKGTVLGVVTDIPGAGCRLVLKPVYEEYTELKRLVRKHDGTVIDMDKSASAVEKYVLMLAEREKERGNESIPEPSGGERYELKGNTHPIKEELKEIGFRWDGDETLWYTWDPDKWEYAISQLEDVDLYGREGVVGYEKEPSMTPKEMKNIQEYTISTDGACLDNPGGVGGWGVVIENDGEERTITGSAGSTTNNRMEVRAIIEGLKEIKPGSLVKVRSDSKYALNVISEVWNAKKNRNLIEEAREAADRHREVRWSYVEGHSGDERNERADDLARTEAEMHRDRM